MKKKEIAQRKPKTVVLETRLAGVEKLIRIGNALGVVLPKTTLSHAGWTIGDMLDVYYNNNLNVFVIANLTKCSARKRLAEKALEKRNA